MALKGAVTVGADPELLLTSRENGLYVSAQGLFGGTKSEPARIKGLGEGFAMQEDGCTLEFNIPPAKSPLEFVTDVKSATSILVKLAAEQGLRLKTRAAGVFTRNEAFKGNYELGCDPDFDAYTQGAQPPALSLDKFVLSEDQHLRFAGGHLHIGWEHGCPVPHHVAACFADVFIGLRSVFEWGDAQLQRRQHYGMPGRYRPKSYGIEYRTLSNKWVGGASHYAASAAFRYGIFLQETDIDVLRGIYARIPWENVRNVIITEDRELAQLVSSDIAKMMGSALERVSDEMLHLKKAA